jgi:hypothetical protein
VTARIWGVSGHARAGKDTVAARLVEAHGFTRVGWADPMKRFTQELFAFSDEQVWEGSRKDEPDLRYLRGTHLEGTDPALMVEVPEYLTPRYALQTIGTNWGRDCYPAVWIEYGLTVARRVLSLGCPYTAKGGIRADAFQLPQPRGVVFSDCRFRNEMEAIRDAGGVLVRVSRPGKSVAVGIAGHASEAEMREIPDSFFDAVIDNSGTIEDLHAVVDWLVKGDETGKGLFPPRLAIWTRAQGKAEAS